MEPEGIEELTRIARRVRPDVVVWRGDQNLPPSQQGLKVLVVPIGHTEFVKEFLEGKSREQVTLFQRIPWIEDIQAAFALLLMCGSTRANYWLRTVQPDRTEDFARRHDEEVWRCVRTILGTPSAPEEGQVIATLALSAGGLGLTSAQRVKGAAHFASWADCLRMVRDRHPLIAELMVKHLEEGTAPYFQAVRQFKDSVTAAGLVVPSWTELSLTPPEDLEDPEPNQPRHGWQQKATRQLEEGFSTHVVCPRLNDSRRALLRSQHGPLASRATRIDPPAIPVAPVSKVAPASSLSPQLPM